MKTKAELAKLFRDIETFAARAASVLEADDPHGVAEDQAFRWIGYIQTNIQKLCDAFEEKN